MKKILVDRKFVRDVGIDNCSRSRKLSRGYVTLFSALTVALFAIFLFGSATPLRAQAIPQDKEKMAAEARDYWQAMPNHLDQTALDQFIALFPNTDEATVAFSLRYALVKEAPTIEGYNLFIQKYPDRFQTQVAIQEVFKLYRDQDRAAGYMDFMNRYPQTEQALVAKLHLQTLMFEFVCKLNTEEDYDAYILTFSDAPHVPAVARLAEQKAIEAERSERKNIEEKHPDFGQQVLALNMKANSLVTKMGDRITEFNKETVSTDPKYLWELYQISRRRAVVINVYHDMNAALTIRNEDQHKELMAKLDSIEKTLIDNNEKLIATVRTESDKVCKELRDGFALLHKDNLELKASMEKGFQDIQEGLNELHNDLVVVHKDLQKISADLNTINETLLETNRKLDKLDEGLNRVTAGLTEINRSITTGFAQTNQALAAVQSEIKTGFTVTQRLQRESNQGQLGIIASVTGMGQSIQTTMSQVGGAFNRLSDSVWKTSALAYQNFQNMRNQMRTNSSGSSRLSKILGNVVGVAAGAVAGWVTAPFCPVAAPFVACTVGKIAKGATEAGSNWVYNKWNSEPQYRKSLEDNVPGVGAVVDSAFNADLNRTKNALIDIAGRYAKDAGAGVPEEVLASIKGLTSFSGCQLVVNALADYLTVDSNTIMFMVEKMV